MPDHKGYQDFKTHLESIGAGDVGKWIKFTSNLSSRGEVFIMNNGVNDDRETDHKLDIMFYQGDLVAAAPSISLWVGDSVGFQVSPDVKIAFRTNTANGTIYIAEYESLKEPVYLTDQDPDRDT